MLRKLLRNVEKNSIILFSCSMPAKSLIHKILEFEKEITCLDIGSGFDSMCGYSTRDGQLGVDSIKIYYN